jgi:SPP1 family predicted phage head-tail adaptor
MSALALRLNKRVTLQSRSTDQDATGQPLNTWADVATVWAEVNDISGREYLAAGGVQNSAQTKITIRYRDGVVPSMRVLHGDAVYNIEAVLGRDKRTLLLMCSRAD